MKVYKVKVNGKVYEVELEEVSENAKTIAVENKQPEVVSQGSNNILAPIAGKVLGVKVEVGDSVKKNQTVAIIEAMKLENEIQSSFDGKVKQVLVSEGDNVKNKDILIVLE